MIFEGIFHSSGHLRWNLGWPSPNYAGAFWVTVVALIFGFSYSRWRTIALISEIAAMFLIVRTYSRGALVAWGAAWIYGFLWSYIRGKKITAWITRAGIIVILLLALDFDWRRTSVGESRAPSVASDASVVNRIVVWKSGLQMSAAAPFRGWGSGESGRAYMNWYQALDRDSGYTTMVNSYLDVGVEYGLPALALAVAILGSFVAMGWLGQRTTAAAGSGESETNCSALAYLGGGAALLAWAVANVFTTLWIESRLWMIPGVAAALLLWRILFHHDRIPKLGFLLASLGPVVAVVVLYFTGQYMLKKSTLCIIPSGESVVISKSNSPALIDWHVWPDPLVLGPSPGKEIRRWLTPADAPRVRIQIHPSIARGPDSIPNETGGIMLFGRHAGKLDRAMATTCNQLWIVHPTVPPVLSRIQQAHPRSIVVILPEIDEVGNSQAWQRWSAQWHAQIVVSPESGIDIRSVWPAILSDANHSEHVYNEYGPHASLASWAIAF